MPASRLPWIKLWEQAIDHEKVALLPDALFRTWVHVLVAGSQQPVRWRFASAKHAAIASGRPLAHIRQLIAKRLLDATDGDALVVHDWRDWQEVYPSDVNRPARPKRAREHSANTPRTLRDDSTETGEGRREMGEGRREKTLSPGLDTSPAGVSSGGGSVVAAGAADPPPAKTNGHVSSGNENGLESLFQAFEAVGLPRPKLRKFDARDAADLLRDYEPDVVARCWQDIASGEYGDDFDRGHLSFSYLAGQNRVDNWLRQHQNGVADDEHGEALLAGGTRT